MSFRMSRIKVSDDEILSKAVGRKRLLKQSKDNSREKIFNFSNVKNDDEKVLWE